MSSVKKRQSVSPKSRPTKRPRLSVGDPDASPAASDVDMSELPPAPVTSAPLVSAIAEAEPQSSVAAELEEMRSLREEMKTMMETFKKDLEEQREFVQSTSKKMMKALKMALEYSSAVSEVKKSEEDANEKSKRGNDRNKRKRVEEEEYSEESEQQQDNGGYNSDQEDIDMTEHLKAPSRLTDEELVEQKNPKGKTRLFLKGLHTEITKEKIEQVLSRCGKVEKVWFVKDRESNGFYGTAFVEMESPLAAAKAMGLKGVKIMGKEVIIRFAKNEKKKGRGAMATEEDMSSVRPVTVFVGNIPGDADRALFKKDFKSFGSISSLRFVKDQITGKFKNCAFVAYTTKEAAEAAIGMNGQVWMGKTLNIEYPKK